MTLTFMENFTLAYTTAAAIDLSGRSFLATFVVAITISTFGCSGYFAVAVTEVVFKNLKLKLLPLLYIKFFKNNYIVDAKIAF